MNDIEKKIYEVNATRKGLSLMSSIICKCNKRITNVSVPNEVEYLVYNDFERVEMIDEYFDKMCLKFKEYNKKSITDIIIEIADNMPKPKRSVWQCPKCKRIYIFENGLIGSSPYKIYKLEEENSILSKRLDN